ncbi:MAG: hypothetical protein ACTHNU_07905, partial [Gaiellales bacterium]
SSVAVAISTADSSPARRAAARAGADTYASSSGTCRFYHAAVIVAGLFLGIVNTVLTEKVMDIGADNRAATSSAYSFVRFAGGGIAPFLAGKMAEHVSVQLPFYVGAISVAVAVVFLYANRRHLAETHVHHPLADAATAEVLTAGDLD